MTGLYHTWIVALSIVVAISVSYAALMLSAQVARSTGLTARLWLAGGATCLGVGIWAMHFIGMMAFGLPVPLAYDIGVTVLSLVIAIAAAAYALSIASAREISAGRLLQSAVILGAGISAMHYVGMSAITMQPGVAYEPRLLFASIALAIAASYAALWLFFRLRHGSGVGVQIARASAATIMGAAICGMHYTGMAATIFAPGAYCIGGVTLDQNWLAITVAIVALGLIAITSLLLLVDMHMASRARRHAVQLQHANEKLQHAATHDGLTGLPNRSLLADRLQQALAQAQRQQSQFAVALVDLDRFKSINDSLGHLAGDEMLCQVAHRLQMHLRRSDTLARMGGDEFVLILQDVDQRSDAERVLAKVQQEIVRPMTVGGVEVQMSASIGVALCPADGREASVLLKHADAAMYHAKHAGRNTVQFFSAGMASFAREQFELESGLRKALDDGEFVLHYQPKVDVQSGRIDGAEALIRWQHPTRGLVPPAAFIPIAEENGMIVRIGAWVLREACRQLRRWHDAGFTRLRMSVNVSAEQFQQASLIPSVEAALREAGVKPELLELELTESSVMRDVERSSRILDQLVRLGVRVSVDDFGTGYSSLSYLRRLPLHRLKIDRSFIRDVETSRDDAEIVRAIVSMAHSLRLDVTAEGVETSGQLEFVRELGCAQYQGFLCSAPLPAEEFLQAVRSSASTTQRLLALGASATRRMRGIQPA